MAWQIWKNRCSKVFKDSGYHKEMNIHEIVQIYNEWKQRNNEDTWVQPTMQRVITWKLLSGDRVKINTDGSYLPDSNIIVSRGILRDKNSTWLEGFSCNLGRGSVLEAEL